MRYLILLFALFFGCSTSQVRPTYKQPVNKYSPIARLYKDGGYVCTAFIISDRYAMTAAHCVVQENMLGQTSLSDGMSMGNAQGHQVTPVDPVGANVMEDYALLAGDFSSFKKVQVDFSGSRTKAGEKVVACGYPWGSATLKCSRMVITGTEYFQLKAQGDLIFPGHSGGPVFDAETGKVVALNSAVAKDGIILTPLRSCGPFFKMPWLFK